MQTVQCPNAETLKNLLLGTLTRGERELLEEHLLSCVRCVSEAETIVADDDLTALTRAASPLLPGVNRSNHGLTEAFDFPPPNSSASARKLLWDWRRRMRTT